MIFDTLRYSYRIVFFKSAGRVDTMFGRHISLCSNFYAREFNARELGRLFGHNLSPIRS